MTYTIDEQNNITLFGTPEEAAAATQTPFDTFQSETELAELAGNWPDERLVAIWNSLPGVKHTETTKVKDRKKAVARIWNRIQQLGQPAAPTAEPKPEAEAAPSDPLAAHEAASAAPSKKPAKAAKKSAGAKAAPKGKKAAKAQESSASREGSKTGQVVAMLQRKNGATITEIMEKMDWQRHTVRGFMAGAMKKAGYEVESFKPEGGERSYRLPK